MLDGAAEKMERKDWMSLLAKARPAALAERFGLLGDLPDHQWLRAPEIGAVMVRGKAGGTGAPFNLGEMTVTRCSLQLADGAVGHGYVPGRDRDHARRAAIADAMMQGARAGEVMSGVLVPLRDAYAAEKTRVATEAEKTRVDFFTMVRGEG